MSVAERVARLETLERRIEALEVRTDALRAQVLRWAGAAAVLAAVAQHLLK